MKKIFVSFLLVIAFLIGNAFVINSKGRVNTAEYENIKGIYVSYLEYLTYFNGNSLTINKAYINKMLDNIEAMGFNTIFLHVSPFSDSIYDSDYFPYSYTLTGTEGKNPGMDYLDYFIKESNKRHIKIHAWINPYRILLSGDTSLISKNNPAYSLLNTNSVKVSDKGTYYNPASSDVTDLLIKQVYEIISNYDVAGIHFDDYFYVLQDIDLDNYHAYTRTINDISLEDYRYMIINNMVKRVYQVIKDYNKNLIFSIAPDGNINNNYKLHYADVKTWVTNDGYIDIIMPQVYYGFENQYKPFIETVTEWNDMITNNVKLIPALAFYKVGKIDDNAGVGKYEWITYDNIIERQINYINTLSHYDGLVIFRYDFLYNPSLITDKTNRELINMRKSLQNN